MKLTTNNKVLINKDEMLLIRNLIASYNSILDIINNHLTSDNEEIEVPLYFIQQVSEGLDERVGLTEKYILSDINEELENKFKIKVKEYRNTKPLDVLVTEDLNRAYQVFELVNEIISISNDLYKLRDYTKYLDDVVLSLNYFCSKEIVDGIKKEYENALALYNLDKVKLIVDKVQKMILNHWQEYVTNVDTYNGGKYNFICHSTDSTKFDGDFFTRYVSCSLLTEELTDTYRSGFGFIMSPIDIVAASSSDMYVINNSENEEGLLYYTSVKKLDGPEKIVDEALKQKKKNIDYKYGKIYTEVVVQGFNPLAIFCLTDGSKMLDYNYTSALKLKESYPNLKILVLDKTKNKTESELKKIIKSLVERIRKHLKLPEIFNDSYYESFDLFWNAYQELINQDNYTEEDIITLFKYHDSLLSIFLDERKLFETYDINTIRHILYYNYKFRIIDILNGNYNMLVLDRLSKNLSMYKYDKRIEEIVPGITTFLRLYPSIVLSDDDKYKICTFNNIESINDFLVNVLHNKEKISPTFETDDTLDKFFSEDINITNLYSLYDKIKLLNQEGRVDNRYDVQLFLKIFPSVKPDNQMLDDLKTKDIHNIEQLNDILLDNISRSKLTLESKISQYESKLLAHEEHLQREENNKKSWEQALSCKSYEPDYIIAKRDYEDIKEEINNILKQIKYIETEINSKINLLDVTSIDIESLSKHRIINKRKLNSLNNTKNILIQDKKYLERKISYLNTRLIELRNSLKIVADTFKRKTGFNLQDYEEVLKSSDEILSNLSIDRIYKDINMLHNTIDRLKKLLDKYKSEKNALEMLEGERRL